MKNQRKGRIPRGRRVREVAMDLGEQEGFEL